MLMVNLNWEILAKLENSSLMETVLYKLSYEVKYWKWEQIASSQLLAKLYFPYVSYCGKLYIRDCICVTLAPKLIVGV